MENIKTRSTQYDPLNDFLFFKTFGERGDEVQLLGFINAVLGKTGDDKLVSVEILENTTFMADIMDGKSCSLDVRAQLPDGTMVNIEVQLQNEYNMDRRSLFYLGKEYVRKLKAGEDYVELEKVIAINILNYNYPKTKSFHSCFRLREDEEPDIILTDALEVHFINMVKYRRQARKKSDMRGLDDPLRRWLVWLDKNSPPEVLEEVVKMDVAIRNADKTISLVTMSEKEMDIYERRMKAEWDRVSSLGYATRKGEARGLKRGQQERNKTIARNLLTEGSTPDFVQKITGLSLDEIAKL